VAHQLDDQKTALAHFQKGEKDYLNPLCEVNRQVVQGKKLEAAEWIVGVPPEAMNPEPQPKTDPESIEGIHNFMVDLEGKELEEIGMSKGACYYLDLNNSHIVNLTTADAHELFFQISGDAYDGGTVTGIKRGSSGELVLKKYGQPQLTLATRSGVIYYYRSQKIAFFVEKDVVKSWMVHARY
jgi:hypothetical protein